MEDDLDDITRKLADDADDLDLDSGSDLEPEDDVINLLDDEPPALPSGGGLAYEEPDPEATSGFAETLQAQQATLQQPKQTTADDDQGPDSLLDNDDPMLLLDEELVMDKDANDGGILTIAALVLAVLGIAVAGFATFQNMDSGEKIDLLATQLESIPPDPKLAELEAMVAQNDKKMAQIQSQQSSDAASLKDLDDRLGLLLEETRKDDTASKLDAINRELKGLGSKLSSMEKRMNSSQGKFEQQQEALRSEFSDRLRKLSTSPPPTQVTASTDPTAVQVLQPQTGTPPPANTPLDLTPPDMPQDAQDAPPDAVVDAPVDSSKGLWVANLASFHSDRDASRILKQLQGHGIFPKKRKVEVKGKTWYRLYVDGFANATAAKRYVNKVKSKPGLSRAWVGKAG